MGAIGGVDYTADERKKIAAELSLYVKYCLYHRSREYVCPVCKFKNIELLPDAEPGAASDEPKQDGIKLSFGYQKDQVNAAPQSSSTAFGRRAVSAC